MHSCSTKRSNCRRCCTPDQTPHWPTTAGTKRKSKPALPEDQLRELQTAQTQDDTLRATAQKKHSAYLARSAGGALIDADFAANLASAAHRLPAIDGDNLEAPGA